MISKLKFKGVSTTIHYLVHTLKCRTGYALDELKERDGQFCIITSPEIISELELEIAKSKTILFVDIKFQDGFLVHNLNYSNLDPAYLNPAKVNDDYSGWRLLDIS